MSLTQINKAGLDEIALDHVFTIGASGSSAYTFQGEGLNGTVNNPTLYLTRGKTYRFENGTGGHPIRIQSTSGASGTQYNTGVTNNATAGTVIVEVQHDAPDVLYYQCTSHAAMNGILYITGALADGGVTTAKLADDAVTTAKIAAGAVGNTELANSAVGQAKIIDNAVTTAKIASNAVTVVELAPNAVNTNKIIDANVTTAKIADGNVTTAKIADEAVTLAKLPHGTSSNDGKFLRANNGADPTFETVSAGPTVANQADNRIITATGTTDALNGESTLTYNGSGTLEISDNGSAFIITGPGTTKHEIAASASDNDLVFVNNKGQGNITSNVIFKGSGSGGGLVSEKMRIDGSGRVGIGTSSPSNLLHVKGSGHDKLLLETTGTSHSVGIQVKHASGDAAEQTWQLQTSGGASTQRDLTIRDATAGTFNVTFRKGGGITFNGDTAAANALDDYEEGTWTPTAHGYTGSNTSNNCFYTKIGRLVIATFRITWPSLTSSTAAEIRGLPFTVRSQAVNTHGGAFSETNDSDDLHMILQQNTTSIYILRCRASDGVQAQSISDVSGKDFRGNAIYFTDA